jgi:hypothetical protein
MKILLFNIKNIIVCCVYIYIYIFIYMMLLRASPVVLSMLILQSKIG